MDLRTETEVKKWFLRENSDFMDTQELHEYQKSLDCALAALIYCEKHNIPCPTSEDHIESAVREKGQFWDTCLQTAASQYADIDLTIPTNILLIDRKAVCLGFQWLIDGFVEGL